VATKASKAWVLLSGGIDSTACLHFHQKQGFQTLGIFVDCGQPAVEFEREAVSAVSEHYGIAVEELTHRSCRKLSSGEITGRNAFLLFSALVHIGREPGLPASGIHAKTPYFDCSPDFVRITQRIFDGYCDGRVRISAPFLEWDKRQIWEYCLAEGVPLELTYSCERGLKQPCGDCLSCRDLEALRVT